MAFIIYKITNNINNKIYIGQTIKTLESRISHYKWCVNNLILGKYHTCTAIIPAEINYIKQYDCLCPNGYNIELGGKNSPISEETKRKMSEAQLGSKNHRYGKKLSEEHKAALLSSVHNRIISQETKDKLSKINTGKHHSYETKQKISESLKGANSPRFGKSKMSLDKEIEIYNFYIKKELNKTELSIKYGIHRQTISKIINRQSLSHHNHSHQN